jgi:hypothetical protein
MKNLDVRDVRNVTDQVMALPNLNILYARLALRKNRLARLENVVHDKPNEPNPLEGLIQLMGNETIEKDKKLILQVESEIADTKSKIEKIVKIHDEQFEILQESTALMNKMGYEIN